MADDKNKVAPETAAQRSTGPADDLDAVNDPKRTATYYLRGGKEHTGIIKGEVQLLNREGQALELTPDQYKSFSDKFYTKKEWNDRGSAGEGDAGAGALEIEALKGQVENETPEEANNATNTAGKPAPGGGVTGKEPGAK